MASLRPRTRTNGTTYFSVLYRYEGKQNSTSFEDLVTAEKFRDLVNRVGAAKALASLEPDPALSTTTVAESVQHHIDHRTGLAKSTLADYRSYLRNDIAETIGALPLTALSRDDVARWIQAMTARGSSGKTISNKVAFLSSALNAAVMSGQISMNPAYGHRMPSTPPQEMMFLTRAEYDRLIDAIPEPARPLVEFLVASGARWGEATALYPSDVDLEQGTVRITRAWMRTYTTGSYELGPPKTPRARRTIDVAKSTLAKLDLSKEFVFTNTRGGPIRGNGFHNRIWQPAVERAWPTVDSEGKALPPGTAPRHPRVHDCRHTCASWLIASGIDMTLVSRHLGHQSIQVTVDRYTHLDRRRMKVVGEAMDAMLS